MVWLSALLLCYRITCLWFFNKRFCNKKEVLFVPDPIYEPYNNICLFSLCWLYVFFIYFYFYTYYIPDNTLVFYIINCILNKLKKWEKNLLKKLTFYILTHYSFLNYLLGQIVISIWYYFPSTQIIFFVTYCGAGMLVLDSLSFWLSGSIFISFPFL